jgi:hypothetical protein
MYEIRKVFKAHWTRTAVAGAVVLALTASGWVLFMRGRSFPAAESGHAAAISQEPTLGAAQPATSPSIGLGGSPQVSTSPSAASAGRGTQRAGSWPGPGNTGVPAGWTPAATHTSNLRATIAGSMVTDVRLVNADLIIDAENVTVQRVELQGGSIINDSGPACHNGLVIESVSLIRAPGQPTRDSDLPAIQAGGYTARRVKIDGRPEGFRVAGKSLNCGRVTIVDSFARVRSPDVCGDWHGDGIQGYDGPALVARNVTLEMVQTSSCGGTAPFFYPSGQGNTSVDIDRMLVKGGGYPFRLAMPGAVRSLRVVDGSWEYGPIDVKCSLLTTWDAQIVTIGPDYQPTSIVKTLPCTTP